MTNELKAGLVGAVGIHAALLVNLAQWVKPHDFNVIAAPSSLEISLVSVKAPKVKPAKIEVSKIETPKVAISKTGQIQIEKKKGDQPAKPKNDEVIKGEVKKKKEKVDINALQNSKSGAFVEAKVNEYYNKPPTYPRAARKQGYEGKVILNISITKTGFVDKVVIVQFSGYDILDQSAVKAAKKWRFQPAQRFGVSVQSVVKMPFVFRLDGV